MSNQHRTNGIIEELSISDDVEGALSDKSFVAKDLFDIKGLVTGAGNPDWKKAHTAASAHADAVKMLLAAGATLRGVSCCDEFAFSIDGINMHYGAPSNPQFSDRVSGGSSSGSASAVGWSLVDFALGTDTAGSVRVPASYCGIYGIRPTHGAISAQGVLPLSPSIDSIGWFARDAQTLLSVGKVLLPAQSTFPHFGKLVMASDAFDLLDNELRNELMESIGPLLVHCTQVEPILLATMGWDSYPAHLHHIRGWEAWQYYGAWLDSHHPEVAPDIRDRFELTRSVTVEEHDQSLAYANQLSERFNSLLGNDCLLCIPTTSSLPPHLNASSEELQANRNKTLLLTAIASVARLPQVSIPVPLSSGYKFGLSLIARQGADINLLEFCAGLTPFADSIDLAS